MTLAPYVNTTYCKKHVPLYDYVNLFLVFCTSVAFCCPITLKSFLSKLIVPKMMEQNWNLKFCCKTCQMSVLVLMDSTILSEPLIFSILGNVNQLKTMSLPHRVEALLKSV